METQFTKDDLFTIALAVHTVAELYRIKNVDEIAQEEMDRVDALLKPYRRGY